MGLQHGHHICSRKITKLVTRHHAENSEAINASADSFVADVKQEMNFYGLEKIPNTDQAGLQLELHSTITLLHEGENDTLAHVT